MTQHIQRLIMSLFVSAFLFVAFNIDTQAQQLNTVWERTTLTSELPSWFSAGYVRGMAHGTVDGNERLYAADRTNTTIRVMDPETGADITPATAFDLSGVGGGTYALNTIEVSDDGVIFLGNLTVDAAASPFRLYWWDSEGGAYADSLTLSGTGRLGDRFTVVGSVADNTVEVWIPAAGSDPGTIYVATTADQGANWDIETITVSGDITAIGTGVTAKPFAPGRTSDFYVAGNALTPTRYDASGAYVTDSQISSTSRNGFDLFTIGGVDHLAVYTYRPDGVASGAKTGQVYVYDVTDPTSSTIVGESPLMGPDADSFSSIYGEARVRVNEDDTYTVFALEGVNGLASFTNAEPAYVDVPSKLFFSEYIEGSSNNKALEITNNTDSTVILTNYFIEQSSNGNGWQYYHSFAEGATIEAGGQYVLITDQVDTGLFAHEEADEVLGFPSPIHFNGDDARALIHIHPVTGDTTRLDIFGDPDNDPGSAWDVAGVAGATSEQTLLRKPDVSEGNTTILGSFGTNEEDSEWIVNAQNDFSNLGEPTPVPQPLAGDYYIPQGTNAQGFASLAAAIDHINEMGLSGATTLYINTSDTLDESGNALVLERGDLTETNSLTIKPAAGASPVIEVASGPEGDGLWINGTDYVTIDGSNEPGGNTRDLTFTSSDADLAALFYVYATTNTTISNSNLAYTGENLSVDAIVTNESGPSGTTGLSVVNNQIGSADGDFDNGVGSWGTSSNNVVNTTVANNEIYAGYRGIATWWSDGNEFVGNKIMLANPREDKSRYAGIYLALNLGTTNVVGNEFSSLAVNRSASAGYAAGVLFNASLGTVNIFNNTFAADGFTNTGAALGNNVYGIAFDNPAGNSVNSIYHNTFRIGSSSETGIHAAFGAQGQGSTDQTWDFQNNIFTVDQDEPNAYGVYWPVANVDNLTSDYNNFDVSGSAASAAYFNDAETPTLADWQTASGTDANSSDVTVEYVSGTDLRLTGASIGDNNLAGTPLASVITDIDGTDRSTTAPYKGAFEGDVELTAGSGVVIGDFALTTPDDDFSLDLNGELTTVFEFSWEAATEAETYTFHLDSLGGDFSDPLFSVESDDDGTGITSTPTYSDIDSVMATLGVAEGESIELSWTVTAHAGEEVKFATAARAITITRNLGVSNEIEDNPREFSLSQNYPNPFNPTSNIQFTLPQQSKVKLEVFNINGQLVRTLVNSRMSAGEHTVKFNASDLASGIYIYRIIAGDFVQTKKMTLIK